MLHDTPSLKIVIERFLLIKCLSGSMHDELPAQIAGRGRIPVATQQRSVGAVRRLRDRPERSQGPGGPVVAILQRPDSRLPRGLRRDSCCDLLVVFVVRVARRPAGRPAPPRPAEHMGRQDELEGRLGEGSCSLLVEQCYIALYRLLCWFTSFSN